MEEKIKYYTSNGFGYSDVVEGTITEAIEKCLQLSNGGWGRCWLYLLGKGEYGHTFKKLGDVVWQFHKHETIR